MLEEIEEFLRRAAEKRAEAMQPPGQQQRPQRPIKIDYVEPDIPDVEIIEPEIVDADLFPGSVSQHVAQHLDTSAYGQSTARLGQKLGLADEKVEARLHRKFDHRLGALDPDDAMASDEPDHQVPATPSEIAKLLGSPKNIRNAIILNEILQPPRDRW